MRVLISGCSFTHWPEFPGGPNICWPKYLQNLNPNWTIKNIAEPAAGNQYIADSVVRAVMQETFDHVLVMWSGVSRLDFLTSLEDPYWERLFDSYGFYRRVDQCPNKLGWIFSGGQVGTWYQNDIAKSVFSKMYKISNPLSLASINLMEMIKTQNFLQNKKIPYHFMSYVNYWNTDEFVSRNGDFGVLKYPELELLIREIDFTRWIFINNNRDGVYEVSKDRNSFQPDGFHPGNDVSEFWADIVNQHVQKYLQSLG